MIQSHNEKFAVFAGKLPAILKLPLELPAKSPCSIYLIQDLNMSHKAMLACTRPQSICAIAFGTISFQFRAIFVHKHCLFLSRDIFYSIWNKFRPLTFLFVSERVQANNKTYFRTFKRYFKYY